jgi:hypothetical protein
MKSPNPKSPLVLNVLILMELLGKLTVIKLNSTTVQKLATKHSPTGLSVIVLITSKHNSTSFTHNHLEILLDKLVIILNRLTQPKPVFLKFLAQMLDQNVTLHSNVLMKIDVPLIDVSLSKTQLLSIATGTWL